MVEIDRLGRSLRSLRLSVTDRCNLRCQYCMPEADYTWLPHASILSFEELARVSAVLAPLGVDRLRLTGGEPLLRRDLHTLIAMLAGVTGVRDLALTTNGLLLAEQAKALRRAGLRRLTISLDTLEPQRFAELTGSTRHADVLAGIEAAGSAGFEGTKLNAVVMRGFNDDEVVPLVEFARAHRLEMRFIEYMDVGGATRWSKTQLFGREAILERLRTHYGVITPAPSGSAPAQRFFLSDGSAVGIIASVTAPFCRTCDRARLTADGMFYLCLYAERGLDLRELIRGGASDSDIATAVAAAWRGRADRGAEERAQIRARGPLLQIGELRRDPHLEMHTRGG